MSVARLNPVGADPDEVFDAFADLGRRRRASRSTRPGGGAHRVVSGRERDPHHADRVGQEPGRRRRALRRAGPRTGAPSTPRRSRRWCRRSSSRSATMFGADNVGMLTGDAAVNPDAPDHLLHRRDPGQHRAARGRRRRRRPGRDGRVPLLRRPRPRLGLAGAAARAAAGAVPADVGDARRRHAASRTT